MESEKKLKILYAEDEPITRMLIKDILDRMSDAVSVTNGLEAYEKFMEGGFDVIVTDLSMPKMSGFELISKIRETEPDIPILVTTAFREEYAGLEEQSMIIEKPIDIEKLISAIKSFES